MSGAGSRKRSRPLIFLLLSPLLVGRMAMAQGENLIRNPGFETVSGPAPAEWETWTPRAEIAPEFAVDRHGGRRGHHGFRRSSDAAAGDRRENPRRRISAVRARVAVRSADAFGAGTGSAMA